MSDDNFAGFAPPPFNPESALEQIKRALRDLKLSEKGGGFELGGKRVIEMQLERGAPAISVRLARKLALTPEFDKQRVASSADQRKLIDEVKKRLARWDREE
jgi:hypothetical protein